MFSIYSTAFNVVKNNFDYEEAIDNFCSFAEEVVISVNQSEDNTYEELSRLRDEKYSNLKCIIFLLSSKTIIKLKLCFKLLNLFFIVE